MSTKIAPHLQEAQRLLDAGMKLVRLHNNEKRPMGDGWNVSDNLVKKIDPTATGYGIVLAANGLCSVDPDDVDAASIGLKALGFELEDIMALGVRTASTRAGSGGRSAFKAVDGLTWIKFSSREGGTALEFRAQSPNLQDCCPGVQYLDKGGELCEQAYDPFTEHLFDDAPELPQHLLDWWMRCSTDVEFLRDQQEKFFAPQGMTAHRATSSGKSLAFSSRLRGEFNKATSVESILERHGYTKHGRNRWAPSTATGAPAVRFVQGTDNLWHSDHASDPLFGNFDAWLAYVVLDHNGDQLAAEASCPDELLDAFEVVDTDTGVVAKGFDALLSDAGKVATREDFQTFANKIRSIKKEVLTDGDRTVLAGVLSALPYMKGKMSKAEVKKELAYSPPMKTNRPKYERDDDGNILNSVSNVVLALSTPSEIGLRLAFDTFTSSVKFTEDNGTNWVDLTDSHYVGFQIKLERLGIYRVSTEVISKQISYVADVNKIDSAQVWLSRLEWDGVPRIEKFYVDYFGAEDTPYIRSVGLYTWTALAGRVIRPGIQADMIPVLVGDQGVRKSTGIKAMSPSPEFFSEFSFSDPENESARKMRGTLVGEMSELRGITTKEKEHIKGWVTRTHEQYRPVYREHMVTFPRRALFFGTTNNRKFLVEDSSGQRRWLPVDVSRGEVEKIRDDCLQLWAEGASVFSELKAISYRQAETLAKEEHERFIETDAWEPLVVDWLLTRTDLTNEWVTTTEVCLHGVGLLAAQINAGTQRRVATILEKLGYKHMQLSIKQSGNGKRQRAYFPPN